MSSVGSATGCPRAAGRVDQPGFGIVEGHVRAGAAHVERDDGTQSGFTRGVGSADDATGRSREQHACGMLCGDLGRHGSTRALQDREPLVPERRRQLGQIARQDGGEARVDDGGREAFELAVRGEQFARARDRDAQAAQGARHALLDRGVRVAVQQADRDALGARLPDAFGEFAQGRVVGTLDLEDLRRASSVARVRPRALADRETTLARNERLGAFGMQRVQVGTVLAPDLDQVTEACVRDQRGACDAAGQQGVQGDRGAVHDLIGGLTQLSQAGQDRARRVVWCRGNLGRARRLAGYGQDQVGEGAARVDTDAGALGELARAIRLGATRLRARCSCANWVHATCL